MTALPDGMTDVPSGQIAAIVTYLQMTAPNMNTPARFPDGITAKKELCETGDYRSLFRAIGAPWLWSSRLEMTDDSLGAILSHPDVETWVIRDQDQPIGLVEIDHRQKNEAELAYFGLVLSATGRGLGKPMMALAQTRAFARPIDRFFVHTCTLDDPRALGFYQKSGFRPYKRAVETFPDPRADGIYPKDAAPHTPYL